MAFRAECAGGASWRGTSAGMSSSLSAVPLENEANDKWRVEHTSLDNGLGKELQLHPKKARMPA